MGGNGGGGAALTAFGRQVVQHYRDMEQEAGTAVVRHLRALDNALSGRRR